MKPIELRAMTRAMTRASTGAGREPVQKFRNEVLVQ
jgi:hypothetical protein